MTLQLPLSVRRRLGGTPLQRLHPSNNFTVSAECFHPPMAAYVGH